MCSFMYMWAYSLLKIARPPRALAPGGLTWWGRAGPRLRPEVGRGEGAALAGGGAGGKGATPPGPRGRPRRARRDAVAAAVPEAGP